MRYWWVNQNQTYKEEIGGGYMWSPKKQKDGSRSQYYENMTKVLPGDAVFSFRDTKISAIGMIISKCYDFIRPKEFGKSGKNWGKNGWRVDVKYHELKNKIRPKDFINQLRPYLPPKYSPLQQNGDGIQAVYLTEIPPKMASVLINKIGSEYGEIENTNITDQEDNIEKEIRTDATIPETEKKALINSRRGQGRFRENVENIEKKCRVTNVNNLNYLIASHIKPWKDCNSNERLDGENGLLLSPNIDHLFDKGYISFEDNGDLIISEFADRNTLKKMGIDLQQKINVGRFTKMQQHYLAYHRKHVLKK